MDVKPILKEVNSWNEFQNRLNILQKKEKGDAFELLTKLYFKINPALSDYYDEVWLLSEVPQKELEYIGIPSHDLGIDLIAKNGNEYHAIQCKYHSEKSTSVTFKEVSTFISLLESNDRISQGYICSSANITSRNYNKLETKPINLILADSWQTLDEEFFDQARNLLDRKKYSPNPFAPRHHQAEAIKQAIEYFNKENHSRGKLIFPCGSGKSLTGYWMTHELKSKSTIVAVPSLSLIKQTLDVYLREIVANGLNVKWLLICSDEGIGKNDDIVYKTETLGVPCHTDPYFIENWLEENKDEPKVVFTTYQSGRIIAEVSKRLDFSFDVGIFDEAHKTVGSDKKLFSHLLFDENISIDKRIFMTATERFYAGSKDDIISMDDDDIYGATFAQMSFKEAIELDLLTDYKIITIEVNKSEISEFIKENNLVQLNDKWKKETEARSLASMLALRKAMKQFPIKNAVSFHSSIEKAVRNKELQQYITDTYHYRPIDTYTVSGKIPTTKRNDIVNEFASSDRALITNARCLTEGVDVPNIDCIVFADPRRSKVDIVQALGRALRKKEGKDWGYVILPVVYDEETNQIDNENFNEIVAIVRGLASNDERIIEYLKDKNQGEAKGSIERNELFGFEVFSEYLNEEDLRDQLEIRLWDKLAKLNWMSFEEARDIVRGFNIKNHKEWQKFCLSNKKLLNIPNHPHYTYHQKGWLNYGDWLGTFTIASNDIIFKEIQDAKLFVHNLNLKSNKEWREYCKSGKKPFDIPSHADRTYKGKGWKSWGDWLGTNKISNWNIKYLKFTKAKNFVNKLELRSTTEWQDYTKSGKLPSDIPKNPRLVYKNKGWKNMGDWLGTNVVSTIERNYLDFDEALKYISSLGLKSTIGWKQYCQSGKKPINIPNAPEVVYKNSGWIGMDQWLGTGRVRAKNARNFIEARRFVRHLNLIGVKDWKEFCNSGNKPTDIPVNPSQIYKNLGWKNLSDWLGTERRKPEPRKFQNFFLARDFARKLKLKSVNEWREYCKSGVKPVDIPAGASRFYSNMGWQGWDDFLGKE